MAIISASDDAINDENTYEKSVSFVPLGQRNDISSSGAGESIDYGADVLKRNKIRNVAVAIASFGLAILNYLWQFTHPVTSISILSSMQEQSAPITAIGNNGKPTVVDFWAPWCGNCRVAATTLQAVEEEYEGKVNFIMVNADERANSPLIQLFGVDAIPHMALVSDEGDVETALIGPMSKRVLESDLDALLNKRENCETTAEGAQRPICHEELPYKMYDAFGSRQDGRRLNFVERKGW